MWVTLQTELLTSLRLDGNGGPGAEGLLAPPGRRRPDSKMPELRKDPLTSRWVIIAAERGTRPSDFLVEAPSQDTRACPLCEGNEATTPPEVFVVRPGGSPADGPGWDLRVVPNKYPALSLEGDLNPQGLGLFDMMNGIGAHEVIVESPDHALNLASAPAGRIELILAAYVHRLRALMQDHRLRYLLAFRNYGREAGASLAHPHSQLIGLPVVPRNVKDELEVARRYFMDRGRCVFCDLLNQEYHLKDRIVYESPHHIVLAPFASRFPFELHVMPRKHVHDFTTITAEHQTDLAETLRRILLAVKVTLNNPPYNWVLHTTPNPLPRPGHPEYWETIQYDYHWHLEFIPRLTRLAGFEWGTGFYINPVAPEAAAQSLRETLVDYSGALPLA